VKITYYNEDKTAAICKCMIGGTFLKYFSDALLFEADEWDRIVQAVIDTDAFRNTIEAIRKEAAVKQRQDRKQDEKPKKQEQQTEKPKAENGGQEQRHEGGNNGQ